MCLQSHQIKLCAFVTEDSAKHQIKERLGGTSRGVSTFEIMIRGEFWKGKG
jgi:hypothetical protein